MYFQKWFVYTPEMQVHAEGETASIKKPKKLEIYCKIRIYRAIKTMNENIKQKAQPH